MGLGKRSGSGKIRSRITITMLELLYRKMNYKKDERDVKIPLVICFIQYPLKHQSQPYQQ